MQCGRRVGWRFPVSERLGAFEVNRGTRGDRRVVGKVDAFTGDLLKATGILLIPQQRRRLPLERRAHVGPGCANFADDVQLVQFGFWCLGRSSTIELSPATRTACRNVILGSGCDGTATIQYAEDAFWMVAVLGSNTRQRFPEEWPALHRVPSCPNALAAKSRDLFAR